MSSYYFLIRKDVLFFNNREAPGKKFFSER